MAYRVSRQDFERLAEEALRRIPRRYRRLVRNMAVVIEDYPSPEDLSALGMERHELLGMFRGVSLPEHDTFFSSPAAMPDAIMLYQKNIEEICGTEADLIDEIRITVEHEMGHYFGLSEDELLRYE